MAVQKKKRRNKETLKNSDVFKWTPARRNAAKMLASGLYTYEEIQKEIRISHNTLWEWKLNRIFLEEVDRLTLELREITRAGLIRECLYGLEKKRNLIDEDNKAHLDYIKQIADLQGLTKQKIEHFGKVDGDLNLEISEKTEDVLLRILTKLTPPQKEESESEQEIKV